jgi:hypothetical protein
MATATVAAILPAMFSMRAIKSPKGTLESLGLRSHSEENIITKKRIPGSANNKFLQFIGKEDGDAFSIINEAENASARKKGMIFVFNLLLQTLKELQVFRNYDGGIRRTPHFYSQIKLLKKKERRLLYIIAYLSPLTDGDATPQQRDLLQKIKNDFRLLPSSTGAPEPTNWTEMYDDYDRKMNTSGRYWYHSMNPYADLYYTIPAVESYIKLWEEKCKTIKRNLLDEVVKKAISTHFPTISSSLVKYDTAAGVVGPFANISNFIPDTDEHKMQAIHKVEEALNTRGRTETRKKLTRRERRDNELTRKEYGRINAMKKMRKKAREKMRKKAREREKATKKKRRKTAREKMRKTAMKNTQQTAMKTTGEIIKGGRKKTRRKKKRRKRKSRKTMRKRKTKRKRYI